MRGRSWRDSILESRATVERAQVCFARSNRVAWGCAGRDGRDAKEYRAAGAAFSGKWKKRAEEIKTQG